MESLFELIQNNIPWLIEYKYIFFFIGATLEGFSTMVLGGFLASVGGLNKTLLFFVMSTGYILNGFAWYLVGLGGGATALDKWGHRHKISHDVIDKVGMYFNQHSGKAIILTKFTFGFTIAIMIMAGSFRYNIKKFFLYNSMGSLGWAGLTMGVGYFFGESLKLLADAVKNFTLFLVFLAGAIAVLYLIKTILKKYFKFTIKWNERLKQLREWINFDVDNKVD
jgi:membrane protein DedA with SNARE-associated domain